MRRLAAALLVLAGCTPVWDATHEGSTCTQAEWFESSGGGEFNSGNADATPLNVGSIAHGGTCVMRLRATAPPESGTRMFRWKETREHDQASLGAWFLFPDVVCPPWWNIMQLKTVDGSRNDPAFTLNVDCRTSGGPMFLYLYDHLRDRSFSQSVKNVPTDQWTHIVMFVDQSASGDGRLAIQQDGTTIVDLTDVSTKRAGAENQWSVNNYSADLGGTRDIYVDDAQIAVP